MADYKQYLRDLLKSVTGSEYDYESPMRNPKDLEQVDSVQTQSIQGQPQQPVQPQQAVQPNLDTALAPKEVEDDKIAEINQEAKSPYQKTRQEQILDEIQEERQDSRNRIERARADDQRSKLLAKSIAALGEIGANQVQRDVGIRLDQPKLVQSAGNDIDTTSDLIKDRDSRLKGLMAELKGIQKESLTPYQQKQLDFYNRSLELKEKQQEAINERQQRSFSQRDEDRQIKAEDRVYKVISDYEKHPVVKELDKQGISFDQADSLIDAVESGNEIALGALGTKMARAMGEVGVLTDQDVKRYIQAQSLVQKAKDTYGRNFQGQLSEQTLKDIQDVTKKMKKGFDKKRGDLYDRYVKRAYENYGKKAGLSLEDIETRFALPSLSKKGQETQQAPYGDTVEKNGKTYKWNPSVGKYQVVKG